VCALRPRRNGGSGGPSEQSRSRTHRSQARSATRSPYGTLGRSWRRSGWRGSS
jgi:hypothetical protein